MAAERAPRVAAETYQVAALHMVAHRHLALRHVRIVGLQAVGMVYDDQVAVAAVALRDAHHTVEGGIDGLTSGLRQVETVVETAAPRTEMARGTRRHRRRPRELGQRQHDGVRDARRVELRQVYGHGVESLEDDVLLAVDTVVVEGKRLQHTLLVIVGGPHDERRLIHNLLRLLLLALVNLYPLELLLLIDDVKLANPYFRFLLRVVGLRQRHGRHSQQPKCQNDTSYVFH